MDLVKNLVDDLQVLKTIWFSKITGDSHKERLENFYGPQAEAYDHFRARFLHGRRGMLKECARRVIDLDARPGQVWVDLGGGTGENVDMMAEYLDLSNFEKVYVVDICGPLCEVARKKVQARGWQNVEVVEADVCDFVPDSLNATLVTFSYSLSMIPPFMAAVDKALSYLDPKFGILGVADFYTSEKYDKPDRQHGYLTRWFWRATFDLDGIDLGPERRQYLDRNLEKVYEKNSAGGIPYVPFLKAPYYIWLGRVRRYGPPNGN
ncbi:hypothetical protein R1sor_026786 [Riccia sorocarpa]|uniref:Methyltransferase domain-containing protein n=1 Tax=Riccia sorocarpa TaxID=122646 RepID=A0ABD3GD44_9MARC